MKFSDLLSFSQEYILKGVVNAALGQEIGSVSISVTLKEFHANECDNSECETNESLCFYLSERSLENCSAILSAGRRLSQ